MRSPTRPHRLPTAASAEGFVFSILAAISVSHLLNDAIQSLIPATYPLLKDSLALNYAQVGLVTLTFQLAASILQPLVGAFTDRKRQPYSLAVGMTFSLAGLLLLSRASSFPIVILSVALVGIGSSVFHPESARVAQRQIPVFVGSVEEPLIVDDRPADGAAELVALQLAGRRKRR